MYIISLSNLNILKNSLSIKGTKTDGDVTKEVTIKDDGNGILVDSEDNQLGTVDYDGEQAVVNSGVFDDIMDEQSLDITLQYISSVKKFYDNTLTVYISSDEKLGNRFKDKEVIDSLFKYVLPTGYNVVYRKRNKIQLSDSSAVMNTELESITMGGKYLVDATTDKKVPYTYRNSTTDEAKSDYADDYIAVMKKETTSPNKNHAITEKELMAAVGATSVISIYSSTNNESIPNDSTSAEQNS